MTSVRLAASRVLMAVERGRATLGAEVDRARAALADDRDRGLLVELTAGTLRWQAELDALLDQCSDRKIAGLAPAVRAIVRLGAYQLEHLDRIPVHAIVHESVELTRRLEQPRASGFVNAVLRSFVRDRAKLRLPAPPAADAAIEAQLRYLTTTLSHPEWLVRRWLAREGFEAAEAWCRFNNSTPEMTVRATGARGISELQEALAAAGVETAPVRFVRDAIRLAPGSASRVPAPLRDQLFVQDEASQLVAHAVGVRPGERVLDVCAAPGGKTLVLSADMAGAGQLVAADRRPARVNLLRSTLQRAGIGAGVVTLDAARALPFGPVFDRVLVDAPCSGLGTIRRDPDLKWSRREVQLEGFATTQTAILARASESVRPGGTLVYATCSSEPEENDAIVDGFLARNPRFQLAPVDLGPAIADGAELVDARGFLRTLPFKHGLDAFFAAVLVRDQSA